MPFHYAVDVAGLAKVSSASQCVESSIRYLPNRLTTTPDRRVTSLEASLYFKASQEELHGIEGIRDALYFFYRCLENLRDTTGY